MSSTSVKQPWYFLAFLGDKNLIERNKFQPSSFINLTTRRVFGSKFFKPKRPRKKTGGEIGV
jgi:hypothetical protein